MAILSTLLKSAVKAPARPTADPKLRRRQVFSAAVKEQISLLENPKTGRIVKLKGGESKQVPIRSWIYETPDGLVIAPKFGVRALELAPGLTALKIAKADAKKVLAALVEATAAGELDAQLAAATPTPKPKKPAAPAKAS